MTTKQEEAEALAKERVILGLFRLYRSLDGKANRALTDAYLDPVLGYSLSAIEQAFERFRDGEVDGAEIDWVPSVPRWVSQVKMLDGILNRVRRTNDGITVYRIGEEPPPGTEPLGPIKLELGGRVVDVSHLSYAEKVEAQRTGRLPAPEADATAPRIQRMS